MGHTVDGSQSMVPQSMVHTFDGTHSRWFTANGTTVDPTTVDGTTVDGTHSRWFTVDGTQLMVHSRWYTDDGTHSQWYTVNDTHSPWYTQSMVHTVDGTQ